MGRVTEVTITLGQTVQVRQYEPRVYTATIKMSVDPNERVEDVIKTAKDIASEEVKQYFEGLKSDPKTT